MMAGLPLKKLSSNLGGEFFSLCCLFTGLCFGSRLFNDRYSPFDVSELMNSLNKICNK